VAVLTDGLLSHFLFQSSTRGRLLSR
jgi:hypothetical protein